MKKSVLALAAVCLLGAMSQALAADTANISVTVSLASVISVSLDNGTWAIPPIALSGSASDTWVATVGNTACKLEIVGTDGAGAWTLGATAGADQFAVTAVAAPSPSVALSKSYQTLAASVAAYGTKSFDLTYNAPTSDTKGGGVAQGFTVTIKASAP